MALSNCVVEDSIIKCVNAISKTFLTGGKLFICGNGGSAADAQHMAAELVGRFGEERPGLPAIALTTDSSALTAIANDWNYEYVFKRQLEALGRPGDVILGISTSGASKNVLGTLAHARPQGITSLGLTGTADTMMQHVCDVLINVGGSSTPIIQERMLVVEHTVCQLVEEKLRGILF